LNQSGSICSPSFRWGGRVAECAGQERKKERKRENNVIIYGKKIVFKRRG